MHAGYVVNKSILILLTNVLTMKHTLLLILIGIGIISCSNPSKKNETTVFNQEHWLLGTWMYLSGNDTLIEQWTYLHGELIGVNNWLKYGDSIPNENISLRLEHGNYVLEAKVEDQNNGEGVTFTLDEYRDDKFVFSNLEHDFPQHITYELTHNDSCTATISGNINNKQKEVNFSLVRIPD